MRLAELDRLSSAPPVRTFVQIAQDPLYTVGGPHMISELLARCGAVNVFEELDALAAQVSYEAVLQHRPAMIVASLGDPQEDWRTLWQRWPELPAVRDARLIGVDADHLSRPTPRILEGMRLICDAVVDR